MNFVATADPKNAQANRNSENEALVRAVICAGLYPNVAKLSKVVKKGPENRIVMRTHQENHVELHPKSSNNLLGILSSHQLSKFVLKMDQTWT